MKNITYVKYEFEIINDEMEDLLSSLTTINKNGPPLPIENFVFWDYFEHDGNRVIEFDSVFMEEFENLFKDFSENYPNELFTFQITLEDNINSLYIKSGLSYKDVVAFPKFDESKLR